MIKHTPYNRIVGAILAMAFPLAALADITGQVTLTSPQNLNLDTGTAVNAGGDLRWNGTTLTPQGSAKAFPIGNIGAAGFPLIDKSVVQAYAPGASALPITAVAAGNAIAVFTNGGNPAKVLVTANSGGSITLQFTTYGATSGGGGGGGGTPGGPTITKIQNNSSNVPQGFPNYGVAPSSLFLVGGTGLSDPADAILQDSTVGLPLTLNGASITVTVGGVTNHPALYYAIPTQLAGVLPANTPVGDGTLTVSYKGANSNAFPIHVVSSAVGINNYGGGLAVAQDPTSPTGAIFTLTNSAAAGTVVTLWSTGLGANSAVSDTTLTGGAHPVSTPLQIFVGGVAAPDIRYQGSAGYPGVNIINVAIPQGAPLGCHVPVAILTGSIVSNVVTIPIAASQGAVCSDPLLGVTGDQFSNLTGKSTLRTGSVAVFQANGVAGGNPTVFNAASGSFFQLTGLSLASNGQISIGGCILNQTVTTTAPGFTGLDAGTITVTGPSGGPVTLSAVPGFAGSYTATLPAGAIPANGGSFAFHGSGGTQVGSFDATVNFPNPLLTWTNQTAAANITRSQGLPITWSGGGAGSYVTIIGASVSGTTSGSYICYVPVSLGQFTVPSYILLGLPAGSGSTSVTNTSGFSPFTASGLDLGTAFGSISYSVGNSKYN